MPNIDRIKLWDTEQTCSIQLSVHLQLALLESTVIFSHGISLYQSQWKTPVHSLKSPKKNIDEILKSTKYVNVKIEKSYDRNDINQFKLDGKNKTNFSPSQHRKHDT